MYFIYTQDVHKVPKRSFKKEHEEKKMDYVIFRLFPRHPVRFDLDHTTKAMTVFNVTPFFTTKTKQVENIQHK